jgi:hypothetical protein
MRVPNVMEVSPTLPVKTVPEFIAYARANPLKVMFASSGVGTTLHMSGELFKAMAGINMLHVPYRGLAAGGYADLMTGMVHVTFDNLPPSIELIRAGKLRALAVTSTTRSEALPPASKVLTTTGKLFNDGETLYYRAKTRDCRSCILKAQCCPKVPLRRIQRSIYEQARDIARTLAKTEAFERSRHDRKRVEMLFAHLKRILRLGRLRLRGPRGAQFEFTLAAIAQNLRRLAKSWHG